MADLIATHADDAVGRLLMQYRGSPRTEGLIAAFAAEVQELEDAFMQLQALRGLSTAAGAQLDVLGSIVGQPRGPLDDAAYRLYIAARILLNNSSGTIPELARIFETLNPGATVQVDEHYPAAIVVRIGTVGVGDSAPLMLAFLRKGKGGGVSARLEYQETDDADTLAFYEDATGTGWTDEATGTLGGEWADVLTL
jgi:hypothetical protein